MAIETNPFLVPSELPFELPDFERIRFEHLEPAIDAGMDAQRAEVGAVAAGAWPPTFKDTIELLERSGQTLDRALRVFANLSGTQSTPELRALEAEIAPRLAAHRDAIVLDEQLFARLDSLMQRRDELGLGPEQHRLLERYHLDFVRAGATLDSAAKDRLRALNERLSGLNTEFRSRLLEDTADLAVFVENAAELDGLPESAVSAAAAAARDRGHDGGHLLQIVLPTRQPALEHLRDRALRERIHRASIARGSRGNEHDTRATLTEIAALRAERAQLLGYPTHAAYVLADKMAGSVDAVLEMLGSMVPAAVARTRAEAEELEAAMHADGVDGPLEAWDWAYYAARVRRERFALDTDRLRAYFALDRVLADGVFRAAAELYGIELIVREDLAPPHPDIRIWEVRDAEGEPVGLFLGDFFAREGKRGGAWMSAFVSQSRLLGQLPVIANTLNVPKPAAGDPALLTPEEVRTLFHEFGHALHGLFSDVVYPRLSGTNVPSDFVEFPSQVNEMWAWEPEALSHYARHHQTGEPLPEADMRALLDAQAFGMGYATTEILAAMLLDQAWHALTPADEVAAADVEAFESAALERHGVALPMVPPRYRSPYFNHVFGGGYSAAYYSYMWAEVLDADAADWFREHGGLRRESGDALRREVLSRGYTVDPMTAYRAFRGRDPSVQPLLERRGLA